MNEPVVFENDSDVLDYNKLQEMKDVMGSGFSELIPAYIKQSDEMVNGMMVMLEQNDLQTLERYAHSMKSSSHNLGANILSQLSMELEGMVRNSEDANLLNNKIELVCQQYEKVKPALLQYHGEN